MTDKLYENYTSSAMLAGLDEKKLTDSSMAYYKNKIIPHLPFDRSSRILDIGCGYGRFMKALSENGYYNVYGVDRSREQVEYAKERLGISNVEEIDAISFLKKTSSSYNAIVLLDVLEHLDVDVSIELLGRAHDCLADGGVLILQVPNALSPLSVNRHWDLTHKRAYTTHSMQQSLLLSGFKRFEHHELPPAVTSATTLAQLCVYKFIIRPIVSAYLLSQHGFLMGGVFTANMLTVARKT